MLEVFHIIAHVAAWTGLSAGMLVALIALAWFVPLARSLAITCAITVAAGYGGLIYGYHTGRADVTKEWDAANARAVAEAVAREAAASAALDAKYQPVIAALQRDASDDKRRITEYEKTLKSSARCRLGGAATLLRRHK